MTSLICNNIKYSKYGFEETVNRLISYQKRGMLYKSLYPANKNIVDLTVLKPLLNKQIQAYKEGGYITELRQINVINKIINDIGLLSSNNLAEVWSYQANLTSEMIQGFKCEYIL